MENWIFVIIQENSFTWISGIAGAELSYRI
jgi:hypothetical protein